MKHLYSELERDFTNLPAWNMPVAFRETNGRETPIEKEKNPLFPYTADREDWYNSELTVIFTAKVAGWVIFQYEETEYYLDEDTGEERSFTFPLWGKVWMSKGERWEWVRLRSNRSIVPGIPGQKLWQRI